MKDRTQFAVAVVSVIGLSLITLASLARDTYSGRTEDVTLMLSGGLISLCSVAASWLFRNGSGPSSGPDGIRPPGGHY